MSAIFQNKYVWLTLIVLATVIARLITIDGNFQGYSWDSGNFALASQSYALDDGRPHLPGWELEQIRHTCHCTNPIPLY